MQRRRTLINPTIILLFLFSPMVSHITRGGFGSESSFNNGNTFGSEDNFSIENSFGNENGFGNTSGSGFEFNGGSWDLDTMEANTDYFIHDTMTKILLLLVFAALAIIIMINKRSLRKPLLLISLIVLGFCLGGFLCPLVSVQNVILKYNTAYLLLFLIPTVLALTIGRAFCGYICIFGAIQEFAHITKCKLRFNEKIIKKLQKLKYVFLVYLIIRMLIHNSVIFVGYTPFNALFLWGGPSLSITLTAATLIVSIIIYRPFCQFICPLGAWLGMLSIMSRHSIMPKRCIKCNKCSDQCNMGAIAKGVIDKKECILCGACADNCKIPLEKVRPKTTTTA